MLRPCRALVVVLLLASSGCRGAVNWTGQQTGIVDAPVDLTAPGRELHCSGADGMGNAELERFLVAQGFTVGWRVDGPEVAGPPPDEVLVANAVAPTAGTAVLFAFSRDGEFPDRVEGLRRSFVDRVRDGCT